MQFPQNRFTQLFIFLLFCLAIYFPAFWRLDAIPVRMWDESLFSLRALHILKYGSYMPNFSSFEGLPDHLNTKLPFTTFFQVLGLKIFGINELGVRLPVSLIFAGSILYTCYFMKRHFNNVYIGYLTGLILVCSAGFVKRHMLRFGDQDVPFACYALLAVLFLHLFLKDSGTRALIAFTFWLIAAFLTKNLLAGLLLPGMLLYVILKGQLPRLLRDYRVYLSIAAVILSYIGVVGYLELQYPGFVKRMWEFELMGRYTETIDNLERGRWDFIRTYVMEGFNPFGYILFIAVGLTADRSMKKGIRDLILLAFSVFLLYWIVLLFSQTKTFWYKAPLYPLGALIVSLGTVHLASKTEGKWARTTMGLSWILILAFPYTQIIASVKTPEPLAKDEKYCLFVKQLGHAFPEIRTFTIVDNNYATSAFFCAEKYNSMDSYEVRYKREIEFRQGEYIMTCLNKVFDPLKEEYDYEVIAGRDDCMLIKILSRKQEP